MTVSRYTGVFGEKNESQLAYTVTISPPGKNTRSFVAQLGPRKWDYRREPCLYAGNVQGGPSGDVKDDGAVIDGMYTDYMVDDLFSVNLNNPEFGRYKGNCLEPGTSPTPLGTPISGK